MSTERTERDWITGRFWFRESYGYDQDLPKPEYAILFLKTIMHVAGADAKVSGPERTWVVGFAGVCGQEYSSEAFEVSHVFIKHI